MDRIISGAWSDDEYNVNLDNDEYRIWDLIMKNTNRVGIEKVSKSLMCWRANKMESSRYDEIIAKLEADGKLIVNRGYYIIVNHHKYWDYSRPTAAKGALMDILKILDEIDIEPKTVSVIERLCKKIEQQTTDMKNAAEFSSFVQQVFNKCSTGVQQSSTPVQQKSTGVQQSLTGVQQVFNNPDTGKTQDKKPVKNIKKPESDTKNNKKTESVQQVFNKCSTGVQQPLNNRSTTVEQPLKSVQQHEIYSNSNSNSNSNIIPPPTPPHAHDAGGDQQRHEWAGGIWLTDDEWMRLTREFGEDECWAMLDVAEGQTSGGTVVRSPFQYLWKIGLSRRESRGGREAAHGQAR